jgi:hypothetical protein
VNISFLDWSRYFFFQVTPHLSSQGLSGPRSRPTATQKIWQGRKWNPGPLGLQPDHRGGPILFNTLFKVSDYFERSINSEITFPFYLDWTRIKCCPVWLLQNIHFPENPPLQIWRIVSLLLNKKCHKQIAYCLGWILWPQNQFRVNGCTVSITTRLPPCNSSTSSVIAPCNSRPDMRERIACYRSVWNLRFKICHIFKPLYLLISLKETQGRVR